MTYSNDAPVKLAYEFPTLSVSLSFEMLSFSCFYSSKLCISQNVKQKDYFEGSRLDIYKYDGIKVKN